MRRKLYDIRESTYERPQQDFVCGLAAEGVHCPLGPCGRRCSEGSECSPVKDGDRWLCGRPASAGGACDVGPGPDGECCRKLKCRPAPSARVQRGRWIAACALFTVGILLAMFGGPWRNEILAPGPLTQSHAQIIRRENATQRCASCHSAAQGGLADWCLRGLGMDGAVGPTQSELCLKCHEKLIPPELALAPHSLPKELLTSRTERALELARGEPDVARAGFSLPIANKRDELHCATCHREHHGPKHDLTLLTSAQCNTCHERNVVSLAHGHPEFSPAFARSDAQVAFNHHSHRDKHFAEAKKAFRCNDCHLDDERGGKTTAPFAQACASCHEPKIRTSTLEGIPFLQLPTIDSAALRDAGEDVPAWPAAADGDFDGRLPWPMRLLLAADPEMAEPLQILGPDGDFADLQPDNSTHLKAAAALARGIARLWNDIATRGHAAIEERAALVVASDSVTTTELTTGLSPDTLATVAEWLPLDPAMQRDVAVQPAAFNDDDLLDDSGPANPFRKPPPKIDSPPAMEEELIEPAPQPTAPPIPQPAEPAPLEPRRRNPLLDAWRSEPLHRGVWFADERTFQLRYIPAGHADPLLSAWLTTAVAQREVTLRDERRAIVTQATSGKAAGLCGQCHPPQARSERLAIAWRTDTNAKRGFTKFSHRPHLIQPQLADCAHCHTLRSDGSQSGFVSHGADRSDFEPLKKQSCVGCHHAGAAGDTCLQCHRYHVDPTAVK